jgi:hypothetical protein
MNKIFFVPSKMCASEKTKKKAAPTGNSKKVFGGVLSVPDTKRVEEVVPTGVSDCQVDNVTLAFDLEAKLHELKVNGYVIVNITPIISGTYSYNAQWSIKFSAGYGCGFSYTHGMMIIARKQESYSETIAPVS